MKLGVMTYFDPLSLADGMADILRTVKFPYVHNVSTDLHELWNGEACWCSHQGRIKASVGPGALLSNLNRFPKFLHC